MDKEDISLLLGIAGLILGVISAHAQLRAMGKWALQAGGDKARAWMKRLDSDAALYASNTSALVSYLAREAVSLIWFLFFVFGLTLVLKSKTFSAPPWVIQALMLVTGAWIGNKLADVSATVDLVLRKSKSASRSDG